MFADMCWKAEYKDSKNAFKYLHMPPTKVRAPTAWSIETIANIPAPTYSTIILNF